MKCNREGWLKRVSALTLGLFLVASAVSVPAQREARRGQDRGTHPNWGGSAQLRQTALNAGYNEGIEEGRNDRRRGERFDFKDESDYKTATKEYSSRLGSRVLYQRYFRQGFENGYRDGWNGY
jgi:hypothetical protein